MTQTFPITPASGSAFWVIGPVTVLLLGLVALFSYFAYALKHVSVEVSPEGLRIRGDVYGRFVSAASLVPKEAKQLDLTLDSAHRPAVRTNGTGLPGYQAGWFRLGDGEKALVFLTDRKQCTSSPAKAMLCS
jgi:hypothetical protein